MRDISSSSLRVTLKEDFFLGPSSFLHRVKVRGKDQMHALRERVEAL